MVDRRECHVGGLDCISRNRSFGSVRASGSNSSRASSSTSSGLRSDGISRSSSDGYLNTSRSTAAATAASAASSAAEFPASGSESEVLLGPRVSLPRVSLPAISSGPPFLRGDSPSTPSGASSGTISDEAPSSPEFAASETAQPWSRTGGAMALDAARLIQQVGIQQLMRRRQTPRRASASEQLPDPQPSTWAYSRPVVILDAFWNLAFVIVTAITLCVSQGRQEHPPAPLSIWLLGYAVQCAVHVVCVLLEHERRERRREAEWREQHRGRRTARGRERGRRRGREGRRGRGRETARTVEMGGGGSSGGGGATRGEEAEVGEAAVEGERSQATAPRDQSGERRGAEGGGYGRNLVERRRGQRDSADGGRRGGGGLEEGEELYGRRNRSATSRVVTLDEAASVLITGGALRREGEAGEEVEGLLEREGEEGEEGSGEEVGTGIETGGEGRVGEEEQEADEDSEQSLARRIESANTMFSFAWWLVGFTWILSTIDDCFKDAPILAWATMAFLAFDVFFVVFCVVVAFAVGMAVCCCLPCIIALIYAVADQEGASREQIEALPKFKFYRQRTAAHQSLLQSICPFHNFSSFRLPSSSFTPSSSSSLSSSSPSLSSTTSFSSAPAVRSSSCPCCSSSAFAGAMWRNAVGMAAGLWRRAGRAGINNAGSRTVGEGDAQDVCVTVEEETGGVMTLVGSAHPPRQRQVEAEDAECCVCLVRYEDGCVLRELPCFHHFHAACIDKWLKSHPTCPLCKRDITKGTGEVELTDLQQSLERSSSSEELGRGDASPVERRGTL